jgi:probable HAF family extracellular repeat protein
MRHLFATLLSLTAASFAIPASSAPLYQAKSLGTLGGPYSYGNAINNSGQITGYSTTAGSQLHAFIYSTGTITDLGTLGEDSYGIGINASGQVTGGATAPDGNEHAFLYTGGVLKDLGTAGVASAGTGINDRGQVVGTYSTASGGFLYADGVLSDLGLISNGAGMQPSGINATGQVAGTVYYSNTAHAFLHSAGQNTDLGSIGGDWAMALGINDSSQATGVALTSFGTTHAFLYSGTMSDLGTLGTSPDLLNSSGKGINNLGQVVGYSELLQFGLNRAFLYTEGKMYDLNDLVVSGLGGATLTEALGINDAGQIVVNACVPSEFVVPTCNAFRLDPVVTQTVIAVEYYYAAWNSYFETSFPDEIAALDGGAFGGVWKRTGEAFNVWPQPNANSSPTCRFFSTAFAPKSSHVYTPFAFECTSLKANPDRQFEGIAFHIQQADANGLCTEGTVPLYRLYNNGMDGAPNHRYTTSGSVLNQMMLAGWIFEGNGNTKVFACVPQ